jgi:hypothetical protein
MLVLDACTSMAVQSSRWACRTAARNTYGNAAIASERPYSTRTKTRRQAIQSPTHPENDFDAPVPARVEFRECGRRVVERKEVADDFARFGGAGDDHVSDLLFQRLSSSRPMITLAFLLKSLDQGPVSLPSLHAGSAA